IRKHAITTKDAVVAIAHNIEGLNQRINRLALEMNRMKGEVEQGKQMIEKLVTLNSAEHTLIDSVTTDMASLDETFKEYDHIKETLHTMIIQSNLSKGEIAKILQVMQRNIDKLEKR
ncbi:MAG: hypothetical protein LBQ30_11290, partial [Treponema sp.]|nr:hypothetical protein [Treponema sp.]